MAKPNLALFQQSEVVIHGKMDILELFRVMKLQDFHSFIDFYIENASEVDEINIQIRNRTELNLVGYESKVYRTEKLGYEPALKTYYLWMIRSMGRVYVQSFFSNLDLVHIDCNT